MTASFLALSVPEAVLSVNRKDDAETQMRCRSNGLVLLQARQVQNTVGRRQRRVVRQLLPGITYDPTTFKQRHRQPP